jgi:hypothetical protein
MKEIPDFPRKVVGRKFTKTFRLPVNILEVLDEYNNLNFSRSKGNITIYQSSYNCIELAIEIFETDEDYQNRFAKSKAGILRKNLSEKEKLEKKLSTLNQRIENIKCDFK